MTSSSQRIGISTTLSTEEGCAGQQYKQQLVHYLSVDTAQTFNAPIWQEPSKVARLVHFLASLGMRAPERVLNESLISQLLLPQIPTCEALASNHQFT